MALHEPWGSGPLVLVGSKAAAFSDCLSANRDCLLICELINYKIYALKYEVSTQFDNAVLKKHSSYLTSVSWAVSWANHSK